MSLPRPNPHDPIVVTAEQAEELAPIGHYLLADSSSTGGALSSHRVRLGPGADGARPHRHNRSSELFFIIDGTLEALVGTQVLTAEAGDLLVVPPTLPHAFGAHHETAVDALIVIAPGVERFEYLRQVARIRTGTAPPDSLSTKQDHYDTHFFDSELWRSARSHG